MKSCGQLEARGYDFLSLPLSVTNEWRMDNDPPFLGLADFVAAWNQLKLQPELRLTTVSQAIEDLKPQIADRLPEYAGEFTDWWVNGCASGPREVAASRRAKRNLTAALSPVWGETLDANTRSAADEHLAPVVPVSTSTPGGRRTASACRTTSIRGRSSTKRPARPTTLSRCPRCCWRNARGPPSIPREYGYYVANTAPEPWSGWVTMMSTALREKVNALEDPKTGAVVARGNAARLRAIHRARNRGPTHVSKPTTRPSRTMCPDKRLRFWMDNVEPNSAVRLIPER